MLISFSIYANASSVYSLRMGNFSGVLTIRQAKCFAFDINHIGIIESYLCSYDVMPIETQHHTVCRLPSTCRTYVFCQVVIPRLLGQGISSGTAAAVLFFRKLVCPCGKLDQLLVRVIPHLVMRCAADAVRMGRTLLAVRRHRHRWQQ